MKKLFLFLVTLTILGTTGCFNGWYSDVDVLWVDYSEYKPIYMKRSEMNNQIKLLTSHPLDNPAKIYVSGNYIFINEKYKGIHVIDNTDPANPVNMAYIQIPGNMDFAVKNNRIYADNGPDLITLSYSSDLKNIAITDRKINALPAIPVPDGRELEPRYTGTNVPEDAIVIGFELR